MTTLNLAKWANRYGITVSNVKALRRLIDQHARQQEHSLNGDPHPLVSDRSDKNANARAWEKDSDRTDEKLTSLALSLGFDRVDYGVGLYPVLEKGAETCIMVP